MAKTLKELRVRVNIYVYVITEYFTVKIQLDDDVVQTRVGGTSGNVNRFTVTAGSPIPRSTSTTPHKRVS